jgi:hypothetical protein
MRCIRNEKEDVVPPRLARSKPPLPRRIQRLAAHGSAAPMCVCNTRKYMGYAHLQHAHAGPRCAYPNTRSKLTFWLPWPTTTWKWSSDSFVFRDLHRATQQRETFRGAATFENASSSRHLGENIGTRGEPRLPALPTDVAFSCP